MSKVDYVKVSGASFGPVYLLPGDELTIDGDKVFLHKKVEQQIIYIVQEYYLNEPSFTEVFTSLELAKEFTERCEKDNLDGFEYVIRKQIIWSVMPNAKNAEELWSTEDD